MNTPATATVKSLDLDRQRIFVVDGIFQPDLVRMLHEIFVRAPFTLSDFDDEQTRHIRHWKFDFSTDYVAANPALHHWHREIVARTSGLFPDGALQAARLYCNNVFYGDHQHAHYDSDTGVTALYFANWEWEENWQGETIFYDREGEACYAVAPRPGRLVAFPANVRHRAGVPAKTCLHPRLTVAFKFAVAGR